jgi:hypothetical protein
MLVLQLLNLPGLSMEVLPAIVLHSAAKLTVNHTPDLIGMLFSMYNITVYSILP